MEPFNQPTHSKDEVLCLCWRQNNFIYRTATQVYSKNAKIQKKRKALHAGLLLKSCLF